MELKEAKQLTVRLVPPAKTEFVWLEQALGRVLAADQFADGDLPPYARSRLDGFALISADSACATKEQPRFLHLRNELLAAGDQQELAIQTGECIRVLTGARLPANADAVIVQEKTFRHSASIGLTESTLPGEGVAPTGSDIQQGRLLLPKGAILTPTRLALLAALGCAIIPVFAKPRVALLATGNELKELGRCRQGADGILCNNRHLLAWSAVLQGAEAIHLGIAGDDPDEIAAMLSGTDADWIVSTGGVGHGDRDHTLNAWKQLGAEVVFEEINISPGHRTAFGKLDGRLLMGFSGGTWGAQALFEQLLAPALRAFQGCSWVAPPSVPAILESPVKKREGLYKVVRGTLKRESSELIFRPLEKKSSSVFENIGQSLCYTVLTSDCLECAAGSTVEACFHDLPLSAFPLFADASYVKGCRNA